MEKDLKKKKYAKDDSPSPHSYLTEDAKDCTLKRRNVEYTIAKEKKRLFTDRIMDKAKDLPGVGKYDAHLAKDRTCRPMKKF